MTVDPDALAEALFAASCEYHGYPVNMGRSTNDAPLGFKTCGGEYRMLAEIAIEEVLKALSKPSPKMIAVGGQTTLPKPIYVAENSVTYTRAGPEGAEAIFRAMIEAAKIAD